MMRSPLVGLLLTFCVGCDQHTPEGKEQATLSGAEPNTDEQALRAEVLVARDLLQRTSTGRVIIDSMYAVAGQAPPSASNEMRPPGRTRSLHDSLNVNRTRDEEFVLRLSKPLFDHDSVRITATIDFPSPRQPSGRGYETVEYTLEGGGSARKIRRRVQLGIT